VIETVVPEALVDRRLVKAHLSAGFGWFLVGIFAGFFLSFQFFDHYPFRGIEIFSPGRVRMVHTNLVAYAFIGNMFFGGLNWAIPRLTGERTFSSKVGWAAFFVWNLALALNVVLLTLGPTLFPDAMGLFGAQGIEWGETPIVIDPLIIIAAILLCVNFYAPIIRCKDKSLYVSLWYFSAGLVWVSLTYLMGNYIPQFVLPGASGAAVAGLFIHDLVGLFLTPIGWGLMYYFVPVILKRPVFSHALSILGFWGLAFFYPLNGIHHFLWSPIPMDVQIGAVVATVAVEVVVFTVIANFFMTLRGQGDALRSSLPLRWFYVGMINYFITCAQCAYQVTLSAQKIIHFTDWVVGHAHIVMFGVFGFWCLGFTLYLWPRVTGRDWWSRRLNSWHFWLTALGLMIMFLDLVAAGLVQGFLWRGLAPFEDSFVASRPFWMVRSISGFMIITAQVLFLVNLVMTKKHGEPTGEQPRAEPAPAPVAV